MTNKEYILQKLSSFNVTEATLLDTGIDLDAQYVPSDEMGRALISLLEELILAPGLTNVSESGFSLSWDKDKVGNWYLWLCKKYGVTPNSDILPLLGVSSIIDISDRW